MALRNLEGNVRGRLRRVRDRVLAAGVERGLPPSWIGYRQVQRETVPAYFARHGGSEAAGRFERVHAEAVAHHPLPCNVAARGDLPGDRGWWGYSFRDVPARVSGETFLATIPGARIVGYTHPAMDDDYYPAMLTRDGRALDLREVRFRPPHGAVLRQAGPPIRLKKATWILERVYHNYAHWLTAHLPKILLLRQRGALGDVLLPERRTPVMEGTLRMLGLDPDAFPTFDPARPLLVDELTILGTDRFRPELLRLVQEAFAVSGGPPPHRRVYVSRANAGRRRLVNEDEVWPLLEDAGFQRVFMEALTFEQQVELMRETAILAGPHGAGLTNMMFCPAGAHVVEVADPGFPNPNFYALASGLGHRYWLVAGEAVGEAHPLERDLRVAPAAVGELLSQLEATCSRPPAVAP